MPTANINGHTMYYETHGEGVPVLVQGGWGSFCHGSHGHLPRGLSDSYQAIIIDYRGLYDSDDDLSVESSIDMYADDAIQLLEHLGHTDGTHLIGLVGMGACIAQVMAIKRPDMVRSMMNMGAWSDATDPLFNEQIRLFLDVHKEMGWEAFQRFVCMMSFRPDFYNENHERLLGPDGPWRELKDRLPAHERFIHACLNHNVTDQLGEIKCPTLVVHSHMDTVTSPRMTRPIQDGIPNAEGLDLLEVAHVVAGKEQKIEFCKIVLDWLARV
ncbi:MAG: alpha/beta fold hydrolase [Alphaproteobacteria bacterium]|nr:alpha/beta fold hydrolase [Alphaproteobacteria bacterium]